jgi:hypothetical protein
MAFITVTQRSGHIATLVNLDKVRTIVNTDEGVRIAMEGTGNFAYNIDTVESFEDIAKLVNEGA